jgi:hypothetical protein
MLLSFGCFVVLIFFPVAAAVSGKIFTQQNGQMMKY